MRLLSTLLGVLGLTVALTAAPQAQQDAVLLVVSKRAGNSQIFLANADGKAAKNLTDSGSENGYPAWSPDGKKIAFASDRDGTVNIYVMDADGKNVKQLTKGQEASRIPSWSAEGKKIAFCRSSPVGSSVFVMDGDGSNVKQVGEGDGWDPAFSPNGTKILFTSRRSGDGFRLYAMDADGKNVKELTTKSNPVGFVYPAWSPDGKKIAWTDLGENSLEIYVADVDGKNAKQITKLGGLNSYAAWSPDSKKIAFFHSENGMSGSFFVMDANGENRKEILADEDLVEGGRPAWRPRKQ